MNMKKVFQPSSPHSRVSLLFAAVPTTLPNWRILLVGSGWYGQSGELVGTLKVVSGEWYVECNGTHSELHMGILGEANKEILKMVPQ